MNEPLVRQQALRCSVAHAFRVFTEKINLWWPQTHRNEVGSTMRLEGREGGALVEVTQKKGEVAMGRVIEWSPPERLVYQWYPGSGVSHPTEVQVEFSTTESGSLVTITHREGESNLGERWPKVVVRYARAWGEVLPRFVAYANGEQ